MFISSIASSEMSEARRGPIQHMLISCIQPANAQGMRQITWINITHKYVVAPGFSNYQEMSNNK